MRNKLIILGLALLFTIGINANPIDRAEARLVAQEFVGIDDNESDNVPIAPYYVFSRGASKGYVIVSGDDSTAPIIGYTDSGDFNYDNLPDGLREMLDSWAVKIERVQKAPKPNQVRRSPRERLELGRRGVESFKQNWTEVPILCPTHWHQNYPYNMYCPTNPDAPEQRAVTGCVATAAAQIVYYFRKDNPDTLLYDTPTYSYGWPVTRVFKKGTHIRYDLMRTSGSGTDAQNEAVATLMAVVGASSYLTYGSSTSGQPDQAGQALSGQFNLSNDYVGKWNYSQQSWETLVYNSLKKGSPMLYGATHPTQGGHAVVLDGYQATTGLYHFNFGWGGTGDGYFTIDDETGMNGFNADQRGCLNFKPKKQNLAGSLHVEDFYLKANNVIKATVTNNGTLPYSVFHLRASTDGKMPSSANVIEAATVLASTKSAEIEFVYKPTSNLKTYLFLTDVNGNLLDSCSLMPTQTKSMLSLNAMKIDAGDEVVEHEGQVYKVVNNTTVNVCVTLTNGEGGTYSQPNLRCNVEKFNTSLNRWTRSATQNNQDSIFHVGETLDVNYSFPRLSTENYYRVKMDSIVRAGVNTNLIYATADSVIYFVVREPSLNVEISGTEAVVTGTWSNSVFNDKMGDETVCSYDMTAVTQINELPHVPNPNTLFYTSNKIEGAINNIVNNQCDKLVIYPGHNFKAIEPFTAQEAVFNLDGASLENWNSIFIPFAAEIPYGIQAKIPTAFQTSAIIFDNVRTVDAMTPFLYIISHEGMSINAENVTVSNQTECNFLEGSFYGTTILSTTEPTWRTLGTKNNLPYFVSVEEGAAALPFIPYVTKERTSDYRTFVSTEANLDKAYRELGATINNGYIALAENGIYATTDKIEALQSVITESEDIFTFKSIAELNTLTSQINKLKNAIQAFLEYVETDINDVYISTPAEIVAPVEYYTVSGTRLQRPQHGIVIVKQGDTIRKIFVR